jgi:HK97 family phage major capsid protein
VARLDFENWIPVEQGSTAIQALVRNSVVERLARPEPMASDTKQVPRAGGFDIANVAKGAAYTETTGLADYVELIARKAGGVMRVAEEDLLDSSVDILATKRNDAARNMAIYFDNACLGTTAAANGTTVPYTSVYRAVRSNDSGTAYTADANYTATAGAVTYDNLSALIGKLESSIWFDEGQLTVIASPAFKAAFRGIKDTTGTPIFSQSTGAEGTPDRFFGYNVEWSLGARTSATATQSPAGNPLLIVCNRELMIKGMARLSPSIVTPNPGFALQRAVNGVGFLTDEALMKAAMRRGFVVGAPNAFAVMELTAAP